jgi:hypothetical protein
MMSDLDFKTFFEEFRDKTEKTYLEMSLRLDSDVDILNNPDQNKTQFQYIITDGQYLEDMMDFGLPYELYAYPGNAEQNLALLIHDKVALLVEYNIIDGGIKISFTNGHRSFRNIVQKFFIDYLLPKFGKIVSDNVHTVDAYKFYANLALKTNNYKTLYDVYILNEETGEEELVEDLEQMKRSYGDALGYFDYCYVIKRK